MKCTCCGQIVSPSLEAFRGMAMVRLNGFDARTLEIQGLLATVRYRIKGKQVGKNSSVMLRAQRERDLALEASLEAELQQIRSERDDLAQRYIATK